METQMDMMILLQRAKGDDCSIWQHDNENGWHGQVLTSVIITPQEVSKMMWLEHINTVFYDTALPTS